MSLQNCLGFWTVPKQAKEHSFRDGMGVPSNSANVSSCHSTFLSFGDLSYAGCNLQLSAQSLKSSGSKITRLCNTLPV